MSTTMSAFLNYIASLENAPDDEINNMIGERAQFIAIGQSNIMTIANDAIDDVFDTIDSLAKKLEEDEISEESVKLAEDAVAVAAIWSFGLSMAAFAALTAIDVALQYAIKKDEENLNNHLASADKDIGDKVGGSTAQYVDLFKKNNAYVKASSPAGLTAQTARSYLYHYMDWLDRNGGVTLDNFKKKIEVARQAKDHANINNIYDILDEFTLNEDHGASAIREALDNIAKSGLDIEGLQMTRGFLYAIWMQRMGVSYKALKQATAEAESVPPEEFDTAVFQNMDAMGKFTAGLTIMLSVVDAVLNVYDIVETVERYQENARVLSKARGQYKEYYQNLYDASRQYQSKTTSY